jgi:TolC family type I secretion outer membrane protein
MKQYKRAGLRLQGWCFLAILLFGFPTPAAPADNPAVLAQGAVGTPPATQAAKPLTLDEVVRITLENHSSVKSAQFQIKAQDAVVHQQMAAYYPTVNFNNTYRIANTVSDTSATASKAFDSVFSTTNVTMTLYNFGKREGLVQSARDTLDATQYAYNTTANNIVLAAKQAYYGVLQANALVRVNDDTVKSRDLTLRQAQGFYEVGTKPKSDVTQAEANLYLAEANLITARNGVEVAWANLINAMGVDDYPKQPLAEDLSVTPFPMSLDEAKKTAFASRPELLQFDAQLKAQDQLIAVARRNHLPDFLFASSYGRRGNDTATNLFPLQPSWQVQLSLTIPIFNGFQTTYQVQQALNNYYSIKEQERVERQQVALQVQQNYLNLTAAQEVVKASEAAVRAAKENLELHQGRYQVGYAPLVEVTDAQTTLTTAQTNYVNALVAYKLSLAQLLNAIGRQ